MVLHPQVIQGMDVSGWDDFVDMTIVGEELVYATEETGR